MCLPNLWHERAAQQRLAADETSLRSASQLKPDTLGRPVLASSMSTLPSSPMRRARLVIVTIGVALPYLARIPGTFVHGGSWMASYFSGGMAGVLIVGAFNALSWGSLVLLSFLVRRSVALIAPALAGFGFLTFAHSRLDLAAGAQNAVAVVFIPVYAVPIIGVTFLLSLAVFGRGSGRAAPTSSEWARESAPHGSSEDRPPRQAGTGRFACFNCGGRVNFGVSQCETCEQPFRYRH
jgi:hypothetical protein